MVMASWLRALIVAALTLPGFASAPARAQDYPTRPVTLVSPAAPGGVIDRLCRILAAKFSESWGRQVVVDPSLYKRLPYDPLKGFTPVSGLVIINQAMILNPSVPADTVKEVLALAN